jgi:2,5-furandicarboxylate decarboxylase 1
LPLLLLLSQWGYNRENWRTTLRLFLDKARREHRLTVVTDEVDPHLEMAVVIDRLEGQPLLFERVKGSDYPVAASLCGARANLALDLDLEVGQLLTTLADALEQPSEPAVVRVGPCQEVVEEQVDLQTLPILTHLPQDAGPYITAGVAVTKDPDYGRNVSFHRLLLLDRSHLVARLVEGRATDSLLKKSSGDVEVAICIGNSLPVLVAAATSVSPDVDEFSIANTLRPTPLVKCLTVNVEVPADTEIVLEGRLTQATAPEGPFLDLTGTMDLVRPGPIVEITCITHRQDPIYQALLPGGQEHKLLMGLPREPTIFAEVSKICRCLNVLLTPGAGTWLHGVVQIEKQDAKDGRRAIEAAFRGHPSMKHVVVVDDDVDIYDPHDVEWAIATRFQASRDLLVLNNQPSSSLDPSATHVPGAKTRTTKMGLDATIPWNKPSGEPRSVEQRAAFKRIRYQE